MNLGKDLKKKTRTINTFISFNKTLRCKYYPKFHILLLKIQKKS